jgi:hypothetical protein
LGGNVEGLALGPTESPLTVACKFVVAGDPHRLVTQLTAGAFRQARAGAVHHHERLLFSRV